MASIEKADKRSLRMRQGHVPRIEQRWDRGRTAYRIVMVNEEVVLSNKHQPKTKELDALYNAGINEVDAHMGSLAWDQAYDWIGIVKDESIRYDLRGIAARILTQSLYPRCNAICYPRKQINYIPDLDVLQTLITLDGIIPLGVVEGLDRVSDFRTAKFLIPICKDEDALERLHEVVSEEPV